MKRESRAYLRFKLIIGRTTLIQEKGVAGIDLDLKLFNKGLELVKDVKGIPGRRTKDYKPELKVTKNGKGEVTSLEMDLRSAYMLKNIIAKVSKNTEDIKNILYSILITYLWSAFETYLTMLLREIFEKRIELLKSSESITKQAVIENITDIAEYLIEAEIDKIEHFTLNNSLSYLESRINFKYSQSMIDFLSDLYLLRNIVAHNTGIIKLKKRTKLNRKIKIIDNEIVISKTYFLFALTKMRACIDLLEKHVQEKFFDKV
jgi:hypothetical protein